ncbi:FbpB family small basic protein [Virgibacillus xinjiangensis]|uniref:FbpB family small basic protein n=1 Tax=Virgibacillus xinjiangensis TaxID=393090 RepID=A0ABV7CRH9_9BACI
MKKRLTFEELVKENRQQILNDRLLMDKLEEEVDKRIHLSSQKKKAE